ncbi:MAG: hypothetical protein E7375_02430 [Clostridiales bacterium]|nr:hypothetical protein [Clostridiales bacterium]
MQEYVYRQLLKKVEEIERKKPLQTYILETTKVEDKHRLRMEDYSSSHKVLEHVYQELFDLELADLIDYQNFVGRFDGEFS